MSIRYVNTPQQIADISTKGSCTTFMWPQLLHMFGLISHDTCAHRQLLVAPICGSFLFWTCRGASETIPQRTNLSVLKQRRYGQLLRLRHRSGCRVLWEIKLIKASEKASKEIREVRANSWKKKHKRRAPRRQLHLKSGTSDGFQVLQNVFDLRLRKALCVHECVVKNVCFKIRLERS